MIFGTVLNRTTKEMFVAVPLNEYPVAGWIHNPNLSLVQGVPVKYWDIDGDAITQMSADEQRLVDQAELAKFRAEFNESLWQSCWDYNFKYYSGGIYAQILKLILAGSQKAVACEKWINDLWAEYYRRKYYIYYFTDIELIKTISLEFEDFGPPPYTVADLLANPF